MNAVIATTSLSGQTSPPKLMQVLNKLMKSTNVSFHQIGKNTGLAHTTVKRICSDPNCNPTLGSLNKIAIFFGITTNQLLGLEPLPGEQTNYFPDINSWSSVPILSLVESISWPDNAGGVTTNQSTSFVKTDLEIGKNTFAMKVEGEALEPKFSEGTLLIIDPDKTPKNRDYVLVLMIGREGPQFRQLFLDGPDRYVKSLNPNFGEQNHVKFKKGSDKIIGVVVQAKSNFI